MLTSKLCSVTKVLPGFLSNISSPLSLLYVIVLTISRGILNRQPPRPFDRLKHVSRCLKSCSKHECCTMLCHAPIRLRASACLSLLISSNFMLIKSSASDLATGGCVSFSSPYTS
eukprot:Pompholyxophrys_sp_v1_NODE_351_length_694_cov_144.641628.p2 type:complete len:115 gc:universal NODE_351_length_694_cov_144.641628:392-48(-)